MWGVADPAELSWVDPPPDKAYDAARTLLLDLDAMDTTGRLTEAGKQMADLPTHPRLAHMLLEANAIGHGALAADLAALLEERDILTRPSAPASTDIRLRLELMAKGRNGNHTQRSWHHHQIKQGGLKRVRRTADMWRKHLQLFSDAVSEPGVAGLILALAYPDRIAQYTGTTGRFRLRGRTTGFVGRQRPSRRNAISCCCKPRRPDRWCTHLPGSTYYDYGD